MGWKLKAFLRGMGSVMNIWPRPLKTSQLLSHECGDCGWFGDRPKNKRCPKCDSNFIKPWTWWQGN